ncbi:MAG: hypothetical protein JRF15_02975 [Deltaproteobacteria bacterium]|jgi:tetratricopeptide (TPR) repeat protein|nr:hypothetical protein [Deltaproteobacteria bacterium]
MKRHGTRNAVAESGAGIADWARHPLSLFLLFLGSLLLYAKTTTFGFLPMWDDGFYVVHNPQIQQFSPANLAEILGSTFKGSYHPLPLLSYALEHALWGLAPGGYHATNALLHAFNSCLVSLLLVRLTGRPGLSLFAAILFAVHPVNVENVAWVSERKTLLAGAFGLASLLVYLRHLETGRRRDYAGALALYLLALSSKATFVVLPLVLLLHALLLDGVRRRWRRSLPFFAATAVVLAVTIRAFAAESLFEAGSLRPSTLLGSVYPTMLPVFWKYLGLLAFPAELSGFYETSLHHSFASLPVLASLLGWIAVFALVLLRGSSQVRFWFLWYWVWLLPASNLIPGLVYYADRYLYFPGIGAYVLLGMAGRWLAGSDFAARWSLARRRRVLVAVGAALAAAYAGVAFLRMEVWRDELAFWEDAARKSPGMYKPRLNLGVVYESEGRLAEAEREYLAAEQIFPNPNVRENLQILRARMAVRESRPQVPKREAQD